MPDGLRTTPVFLIHWWTISTRTLSLILRTPCWNHLGGGVDTTQNGGRRDGPIVSLLVFFLEKDEGRRPSLFVKTLCGSLEEELLPDGSSLR